MGGFDPDEIHRKLEALCVKDKALRVFGASGHRYKLAKKLSATNVASVEAQFRVKLPDDYKTFLLEVGAGGAGPAYGIFPLVQARGTWRWEGDGARLTRDLRRPFPHTKKWNAKFERRRKDEDEDAYEARRSAWDEALYWNSKQTTGAICLCHEGCAIRDWLVVSGPQRGKMWLDDRPSDAGLSPLGVTFGDWYMKWLASAMRSRG